jgi:hypothetical protein
MRQVIRCQMPGRGGVCQQLHDVPPAGDEVDIVKPEQLNAGRRRLGASRRSSAPTPTSTQTKDGGSAVEASSQTSPIVAICRNATTFLGTDPCNQVTEPAGPMP